ncbi:MAG: hypothetical protein LVT47_06025 [Cyanobacteria bacterium LVE1205-1]
MYAKSLYARHDLLNFYISRLGDRWFIGGEGRSGTSQFYSPHPKSLSQNGRGTLNPVPILPFWEKGLGDEGKLAIGILCIAAYTPLLLI